MAAQFVKDHPAETAMPLATVLAALIGKIAGVEDTDTILYIGLALSFVPAVVTWIVNLVRGEPDVGDRGQDPRRGEDGSTGEATA